MPTRFSQLRIARLADASVRVDDLLDWMSTASVRDDTEVRARLQALVTEYRSTSTLGSG
jgi:hypothetical protein